MIKRLSIVFGIVVALGLVVWGVAWFLGHYGNPNEPVVPSDLGPAVEGKLPESEEFQTPVQEVREEVQQPKRSEEDLTKIQAGNFVKHFAGVLATYSNQNFADNIDEVLPETKGSAREYLQKLKRESLLGEEYVGTTSKALAMRWIQWNPGDQSGTARLSLWRVEMRGGEERGFGQDMEVSVVKQGEGWVVDEITWKNEIR